MNNQTIYSYTKLKHSDHVYTLQRGNLRCSLIKLANGQLCLFSPVLGLCETEIASLSKIGMVRYLLAPNHYHNKGLCEYAMAFPDTTVCSSIAAIPRLKKQTGLEFKPIESITNDLPTDITILEPEGLKTGEIWLCVKDKAGVTWIAVDAFCGKPNKGVNDICAQPQLLKTFPSYGVRDAEAYSEWLVNRVEQDNPICIVPCHGAIIKSDHLAQDILRLVRENFVA